MWRTPRLTTLVLRTRPSSWLWETPRFPDFTPMYREMLQELDCIQTPRIDNSRQFKVSVDVSNYRPEDISITMKENKLVIKGKHAERGDEEGFISREFIRTFNVPKEVETEKMESMLDEDSVLHITAPKIPPAIEKKDKTIPISFEKSE